MINKVKSGIINGIEGKVINIEVDISNGLPTFSIVGLASTEVKESKERVRSAIINSGYIFPIKRIVVNLSPADLKKDGSFLDLGILVGIVLNSIDTDKKYIDESVFLGELSLDGNLRSVKGIFSIVLSLARNHIKRVFIPTENFHECSEISGIEIIPIDNAKECVHIVSMEKKKRDKYILEKVDELRKSKKYENVSTNRSVNNEVEYIDLSDIKGNRIAKRCAEISVSGGHSMLFIGPPGTGKTMICKAIRYLQSEPSEEESLEITQVYSIAGLLDSNSGLVRKRPFRHPHHTATKLSIIGGGASSSVGEITLANRGILFLDEIAEFNKSTIESLRQPLEDKLINISRLNHNITYPANFTLIATVNPCPCGYYNSSKPCRCSQGEIERYRNKISGPILDRLDLFCEVSEIDFEEITEGNVENSLNGNSCEVLYRIENARLIQENRFSAENKDSENKIYTNSEMNAYQVKKYCVLDESAEKMIKLIFEKYKLSNRSYIKLLKVSRTIADLDGRGDISDSDILEAFSYRKAFYKYFSDMY